MMVLALISSCVRNAHHFEKKSQKKKKEERKKVEIAKD